MAVTPHKPAPVVLVVDDENSITMTLAIILRQRGFSIVVAHSGEDAVRLAGEHAPDFVVSDIVMGEMNGIEAAIRIQSLCPSCRIVLMSGNSTVNEMLEATRARGFEFEVLAKPFHPSALIEKLLE